MMGGGQQTTTGTSEPWSAAQPALKQTIGNAQGLYNQGIGGQVYQGPRVTPFSNQTENSLNAQQNSSEHFNANTAGAFSGIQSQLGGIGANGGMTGAQSAALGRVGDTSSGSYLSGNEYTKNVLSDAMGMTADNVNEAMAGAGRFGSGAHTETMTRELGNLAQRGLADNYNRERGMQEAATGQMFNMGQQGLGNLGAVSQGLASNFQNSMAGNDRLRAVGAEFEDLKDRTNAAQAAQFDEMQNAPWQQLGRLNSIASGAGSMGGTSTQTQPGRGVGSTLLGGASLLGGLL